MARGSTPRHPRVPQRMWREGSPQPPMLRDVLNQIACFFEDLGYSKTLGALEREARDNSVEIRKADWRPLDRKDRPDLMETWYRTMKRPARWDAKSEGGDGDSGSASEEAGGGALVEREAEETSDDSSDEESELGSDSDSSAKAGQKRKRVMTPSSSEDQSSSSDSESAEDRPPRAASSDGSGTSSDSDSSSDDGDTRPAKRARVSDGGDSSSESGSSNSSESNSDAEDNASSAKSSVSSESGSDSSDSESASDSEDGSSSSESESSAPPPKKTQNPATKKTVLKPSLDAQPSNPRTGSATSSSETLGADSPVIKSEHTNTFASVNGEMHPDRAQRMPATNNKPKKEIAREEKGEQVPFSRIPTNTKVDPRFASNSYVPYDYANRAYKDLSVTRGKDFTKEKNKKKRGAYRGGPIDLQPKGIKFDD